MVGLFGCLVVVLWFDCLWYCIVCVGVLFVYWLLLG